MGCCCPLQAVLQQVGVLLGAAEQQGGLAPAPAAAATRIHRLLTAKLEELRSMQPGGGGGATRRPSEESSSGAPVSTRTHTTSRGAEQNATFFHNAEGVRTKCMSCARNVRCVCTHVWRPTGHRVQSPFSRCYGNQRCCVFNAGASSPHSSASYGAAAMSIDDFEVIKPISRGAFGRVYLARKKATGDPFAIKVCSSCETLTPNPPLRMCASLSADHTLACNRPLVFYQELLVLELASTCASVSHKHLMSRRVLNQQLPWLQVMRKSDLIRKNMVQSVKNERNILAMANNPFVVCMLRPSLPQQCHALTYGCTNRHCLLAQCMMQLLCKASFSTGVFISTMTDNSPSQTLIHALYPLRRCASTTALRAGRTCTS